MIGKRELSGPLLKRNWLPDKLANKIRRSPMQLGPKSAWQVKTSIDREGQRILPDPWPSHEYPEILKRGKFSGSRNRGKETTQNKKKEDGVGYKSSSYL